nr:hypothetical protein [Tanacetum cinerariifolium]
MAAAVDLDEIKEVNANCILMANLQQASTSGTQTDNTPVYDTDGSAEIFHTPLDDDASFEHLQRDIKSKAFINSEIGQIALNQEKQHVFNVLNSKLLKSPSLNL